MAMSNPESPKPVVFLTSGDFIVERVFPIRNLLGDTKEPLEQDEAPHITEATKEDDLTSRNAAQSGPKESEEDGTEDSKRQDVGTFLPPPYPSIPPDHAIRRLARSESDAWASSEGEGGRRRTTERATMIPTTAGPPGVFPGIISDGTKPTFYRCEDEPIHTPGAIQQYGVLVALRFNQDDLEVRIASENSRMLLGYEPEQLFQLMSFVNILEPETAEDTLARVNHALKNVNGAGNGTKETQLDVFSATIIFSSGSPQRLWCALHVAHGCKDLVILEFEPYTDVFALSKLFHEKSLPKLPIHSIDIEVHPEEQQKSTARKSLPLRVLELARQKEQTGVSSMDVLRIMNQAQQQIVSAESIQELLDIVVGIIAELTGFHRVMLYRFDSHKNGSVEAELVHPQASGDFFRGKLDLATSNPFIADMKKGSTSQLLIYQNKQGNCTRSTASVYFMIATQRQLVCRDVSDFEVPLDLTHSYLRAISPIHLKYLGNMGVRSSMSVSIVINSDLWGLIACHGYGNLGIRVTLPIRELCRNIGDCAATNIERLLMLQRIKARKPPSSTPLARNPTGFIAASSADLLRVFGADFGLLSIQDEARAIGKLEPYREALAILAYLQQHRFTSVHACQNINAEFPDIKYAEGIRSISGLLFIPLSAGGKDFLVFFRHGELQEVRWAGNPYEKLMTTGSEYLEPRTSFKRWTETVVGMSTEWAEDQIETASTLSLLYGRFIEIWRQKQAAGQNNRMTRLLLENSSHEVRTPLNAIVNSLEMALENKIDDSTRDILATAHRASKSLIYVIDDLLNLTKVEEGLVNSTKEIFDLGATVSNVLTNFRTEALRKRLEFSVSLHQGLPEMVRGDAARLRQVISNVTSNAFQHSMKGGIKVDIRTIRSEEQSSIIGISVQDIGVGMSESQLDNLFQEFEQVIDEDENPMFDTTTPSTPTEGRFLGVGLAVVARYVKNMKGQIRVQSELSKGTIFSIELPFEHAITTPDDPTSRPSEDTPLHRAMSDTGTTPLRILDIVRRTMTVQSGSTIVTEGITPPSPNSPFAEPTVSSDGKSGTLSSQSNVKPSGSTFPFPRIDAEPSESRESLYVLVAEDNPINARFLTRRLNKLGHKVEVVHDGQQCHDHYALKPHTVDVILMDLQMPLVDGALSTEMIREYEKELVEELRRIRPRVPIIAVSASLTEDKRFEYVQSGFDAWLLKPIDVGRLSLLLQGVKYPKLRRDALYTPGYWERGGWFLA
ncbi:hypothetical protein CJF31_00012170 [Rutstroemia sp. NJR-2017a BVV2]|nr:hypothetical protein CJF31_00012170 [Rutstroemia sp. NJR-2017a BVV2]